MAGGTDTEDRMQESIAEALMGIAAESHSAQVMAEQRSFDGAKECVRRIMALASKLYGRLSFLAELEADARFVGEVDRALARAERSAPKPIPGDTPLPLPDPKGPPRRKGGKNSGRAAK